jgi:hypothetical protein
VVEPGATLGDLGIVVICRQRREVEVVVDAQHAGPGSFCHRLSTLDRTRANSGSRNSAGLAGSDRRA